MGDLRAVGLMVASMAAFALGDLFVKLLSRDVAPAQGILLMALFGTGMFAALAWRARQRVLSRAFWRRAILLRNVVEGLTAICFFSAVAAAPLSLVISITQAVPLLVTLGAAVLLHERVGPRRWAAILVGLCGVLVMLRPWEGALAPGALWAVAAAIGLATRDLAARWVPPQISTLQLATWGIGSLIPAALGLMAVTASPWAPLTPGVLLVALVAAVGAGLGYYLVTAAMRMGDVALVAPFRYTRLPFALLLAVLFLGERPDALTLTGAGIVIGSGLFVLLRERALSRQAAPGGARE